MLDEDESPPLSTRVKGAVHALLVTPLMTLSPLLNALPATWRIYHKLHLWAAYQMQRAASSDAVATIRRRNGKLDALPAKFVEGAEDEKGRSGWRVKGLGDNRYDPAVHGRESARLGKADMIQINEDDTEQGTWTEATMDNAFQLDRERYLFRDATVQVQELIYDVEDPSAMADGGVQQSQQANERLTKTNASLSRPGILEDVLVPINSRQGYDGQIVSWNQYTNIKEQASDQETIRDAKNTAWVAAKLDDVEGRDVMKWMLIIGVWSAILLFHQDIGAFIAGLGGGGGGAGGAVGGALG
jgi:hypothetical protein